MRIYLDYNATTPLCEAAREAMRDAAWGNPSSVHREGQRARALVEHARGQVARLVDADPRDLVFTSGATESVNWALRELAPRGRALVTSVVEHPCVLAAAERALAEGRATQHLHVGVDRQGRLDLGALAERIEASTVGLVSLMLVNNEIGNAYPVAAVSALCEQHGVFCHTDATQAVGRLPVALPALGVHLASFSAHKLYGPKGVGALWIRPGAPRAPWQVGGHQERGRRPGTENVAGIVGFGAAAEWVGSGLEAECVRQRELRDRLLAGLLERAAPLEVNGDPEAGAPGTLNVSITGCEGEALLIALDLDGLAVSSGSACSAGSLEPSHVLVALTRDVERQRSAIRFSLGRFTTREEIDEAVVRVARCVERLRG